jgi:hypothetical protein
MVEPIRGTARALFTRAKVAKNNINDYVADQCDADDGKGHEKIQPTGTKFVWDLTRKTYWPGEYHPSAQMEADLRDYIDADDEEDGVVAPRIIIAPPSDGWKSVCVELLGGEEVVLSSKSQADVSSTPSCDNLDDALSVAESLHHDHRIQNESHTTKIVEPAQEPADNAFPLSHASQEAARKARFMRNHKGTSFTALMAGAEIQEELSVDGDSDNVSVVTSLHIDHSSDAHNDEISTKKHNVSDSPTTPKKSPPSSPTSISPDKDTSPEVARTLTLMRTCDGPSLAALIAAADTSEFSSDEDNSDTTSDHSDDESPLVQYAYATTSTPLVRRPCHDPDFPGHSPCVTHHERTYSRSADAAFKVVRRRFEVVHHVAGDGAWYREYILQKGEGSGEDLGMVHGGIGLRYEVSLEEEDVHDESKTFFELDEQELENEDVLVSPCSSSRVSTDADVTLKQFSSPFDDSVGIYVTPPKEHDIDSNDYDDDSFDLEVSSHSSSLLFSADRKQELDNDFQHAAYLSTPTPATRIVHIRNASMNDMGSTKSTVSTSVFSKQGSVTTKTSQGSINTGNSGYSQLMDALDLCGHGIDRPNTAACGILGDEGNKHIAHRWATHRVSAVSVRSSARDDFHVNDSSLRALGTRTASMRPELSDTNIIHLSVHTDHGGRSSDETAIIDVTLFEASNSMPTFESHCPTGFVELVEDTDSEVDYEPFFLTHLNADKPSRRRQYAKMMKGAAKRISGKTHDVVQTTKHFARTLCGFVPATATARNPFAGI